MSIYECPDCGERQDLLEHIILSAKLELNSERARSWELAEQLADALGDWRCEACGQWHDREVMPGVDWEATICADCAKERE